MLHIYITRHGQDEDNLAGILNGRRNQPLTQKGVEQAQELAEKIKETGIVFDAVYASPLQRTFDTAKKIADYTNSSQPIKEPLLIEREFGIMTGRKTSEIEAMCSPDVIKTQTITYFLDPEGAETFPDLMNRARLLLDKITARHTSGNVLLVTHGDIGKMIYAKYYNLDWQDVLTQFHFGNADLLLLAEDSAPEETHVFKTKQYNH